ncbi:MAG: hypothetical protein BRC49_09855 [Cyanobacteria bacterium SW_10_48_33]|jgi:cytidylate kinase|nr:MAG: hypothetical protein BRC39_06970 [Cyanobacteria bacterium QH_7_48_89]PSP10532.1 MAG: hypothetical protein BRC49_09855 [Cyanobacteria bacterium SW_10_48_33]
MYLIEMKPIIEVNEDGTLSLPTEILEAIAPNRRFVVEVKDKTLILYPESQSQPFWVTATPQKRAERWRQWVQSHKDDPNLSEEALRRENMYD